MEGHPKSTKKNFLKRWKDTHLFSYSLLQLPNVRDPPDAVTDQEHPGDGEADLGVPHVPHLARLPLAEPGVRKSVKSLDLESRCMNIIIFKV